MKRLKFRFTVWNEWRKYSANNTWYKLMVLLGITHSPTFVAHMIFAEIGDDIKKFGEFATEAGKALQTIKEQVPGTKETKNE